MELFSSVFRFPRTAKVRRPLHSDDVRFPHTGPRAQAGRPRVPVQVRVRRPSGVAKHRIASEQGDRPESGPYQVGRGPGHIRPHVENGQGQRQVRRAARERRRPR